MSFGFEIEDTLHTRTQDDIGITYIGTGSHYGVGNIAYTFPLESPPDFVYGYVAFITDAPSNDPKEPVFFLNKVFTGTFSIETVYDNPNGRCLVNNLIDIGVTDQAACTLLGGAWDEETPYFAHFEGTIDIIQIGKKTDGACYNFITDIQSLQASTEITLYFYALGYL
jgi:hypothetical protein